MAFTEHFDCTLILNYNLDHMMGKRIPSTMFTDSRSLFEVVSRNSTTTDKRLMVDLSVARQEYT